MVKEVVAKVVEGEVVVNGTRVEALKPGLRWESPLVMRCWKSGTVQ